MKHRIILVGKSAAGKDYARKIIESAGFEYQISYTTRPPRASEKHGVDYYFITEHAFKTMAEKDEWYEYVIFNGWYYGTTNAQFFTENSVFILTPSGLSHLSAADREKSHVIYLDVDADIRKQRISERLGNADSVARRLAADEIDFTGFTDYDNCISRADYSNQEILAIVDDVLTQSC